MSDAVIAPWQRTAQRCDRDLSDKTAVDGSGSSFLLLDTDDDDSCNLANVNDALERAIQAEESKVAVLQRALENHREVNRLLLRQDIGPTLPFVKWGNESVPGMTAVVRSEKIDELMNENGRLRKELDSVTDFIENQRVNDGSDPSPPENKTLAKLLYRLIERRLDCPFDPFIDSSNIKPKDLQILRESYMIETQDSNHICLIDYTDGTNTFNPLE